MKLGDMPAFPIELPDGCRDYSEMASKGLTLRQYYAGLAMQAIIVKHPAIDGPDKLLDSQIAKGAISYADALLAELENP